MLEERPSLNDSDGDLIEGMHSYGWEAGKRLEILKAILETKQAKRLTCATWALVFVTTVLVVVTLVLVYFSSKIS